MALCGLWGQCVPAMLLAGPLTSHGHGYGLGTALLHGRHPVPGDYNQANHDMAASNHCVLPYVLSSALLCGSVLNIS